MVAIQIAPIISKNSRARSFFAPTGSYYMIGTPSVELAKDLASSGVRRLVFSSIRPATSRWMEWEAAERILLDAGVEIVPTWVENESKG